MVLEEWGVIDATPQAYWTIVDEEMHRLISYVMVSVMAYNYKPSIDYIKSHIGLCVVLLYGKAFSLLL